MYIVYISNYDFGNGSGIYKNINDIFSDAELYNMVKNVARRVSNQQFVRGSDVLSEDDVPNLIIREFTGTLGFLNEKNIEKNSKLGKHVSIYEYLNLFSLIASAKRNKIPLDTNIYKQIYEKYL